jgi:fructokinase
MKNIICYGEVLFDVFPTHEKIGGAPLNVASRLSAFNHQVSMISAVGNDHYGQLLITYLKENHINTDAVQILPDHETGMVKVSLDENNSATYVIKHPSAWDNIQLSETSKIKVKNADTFIFGSLIARDQTSKKTLLNLLEVANYKVFDLNLRPPHYEYSTLEQLMLKSDFIKFNDEELYEISNYMNSKHNSLEDHLKFISTKTNTKHLCVTKGKDGAILLYNDKLYYNSGFPVKVADTVGAGDSFLGTLISELITSNNPQKAINKACAVGAMVAQSEGANPVITERDIDAFMTS